MTTPHTSPQPSMRPPSGRPPSAIAADELEPRRYLVHPIGGYYHLEGCPMTQGPWRKGYKLLTEEQVRMRRDLLPHKCVAETQAGKRRKRRPRRSDGGG